MDFYPFESNEKYDFYSFNNAFEILKYAHPVEFKELLDAFDKFYILKSDLLVGGGSESKIPKRFASYLRPSWRESRISADLYVKQIMRSPNEERQFATPDYMDGYLIDYVKGKVAFDMEWNSKDQTFDRDDEQGTASVTTCSAAWHQLAKPRRPRSVLFHAAKRVNNRS